MMQAIRAGWRWVQIQILGSYIWRPIVLFISLFICAIVFVNVILPVLGSLFFRLPIFNPIEPIATPRTHITTNTLPLQEVGFWSTEGQVEDLLITNQNVVALSVLGYRGHRLLALNAETGGFFWDWAGNMRSLDADQERLYIGGINNVQAYDLKTEEKLWEYKQPLKSRGDLFVSVEGDIIKAYDHNVFKSPRIIGLLILDAQTGELLSEEEFTEPLPRPEFTYRTTSGAKVKYMIQPDGIMVGTDNQTGQEIGYLEMTSPSNEDKVAASDEFLLLYNHHNQELLLFKQTD
jgi:hypothetical protein